MTLMGMDLWDYNSLWSDDNRFQKKSESVENNLPKCQHDLSCPFKKCSQEEAWTNLSYAYENKGQAF